MDVGDWLQSLGLGKYEAAFRENDIDETVLPGLTHETLKELGVASVGHRVKLLDAIAALINEKGNKTPAVEAACGLAMVAALTIIGGVAGAVAGLVAVAGIAVGAVGIGFARLGKRAAPDAPARRAR